MKIYVITDLEGVSGVVSDVQVVSGDSSYEKSREWLTLEVNAAVEGAILGGADEIIILDGHGANNARNILFEKLHEKAELIQGTPWVEYLQSLDSSFDGLIQIGTHAMSGTPGAVLEHTMSSLDWLEMRVNGKPMGEIGLGAVIAGESGVPFLMVSGDDKACKESLSLCPEVECAVVKYGISRTCAKLLPLQVTLADIREKAQKAVKKAKNVRPVVENSPTSIEIDYRRTLSVDATRERTGVQKIGPRSVRYTGDNVTQAFWRVLGG